MHGQGNRSDEEYGFSFFYIINYFCGQNITSVTPLLVETFKQNIINTNSWCFRYNDYNYNPVAHSDGNLHIWKPTAVTVWLTHDSALSGGCHMTAKMAGASLYRVFKMAIVNKRTTLWKTVGFSDAHQEAIFQVQEQPTVFTEQFHIPAAPYSVTTELIVMQGCYRIFSLEMCFPFTDWQESVLCSLLLRILLC